LLDQVDRFRQERNSGREVFHLLTGEQWEALIIWDEMIADYKRGHEVQLIQLIASLIAR
jgi:hypothetical protein